MAINGTPTVWLSTGHLQTFVLYIKIIQISLLTKLRPNEPENLLLPSNIYPTNKDDYMVLMRDATLKKTNPTFFSTLLNKCQILLNFAFDFSLIFDGSYSPRYFFSIASICIKCHLTYFIYLKYQAFFNCQPPSIWKIRAISKKNWK